MGFRSDQQLRQTGDSMKLVHPLLEAPVEFAENIVNVLVVENQRVFSGMVSELLLQSEGSEGQFVMSHGARRLSFEKDAELILSPFLLDVNQKKIVAKLHAKLKNTAVEADFYMKSLDISSRIAEYIEAISQTVDYPLVYSETDALGLFKLVDLRLEENHATLTERILDYITAAQEFLSVSFFVFVNLRSFLGSEELKSLYQSAIYRKIHFLLLENTQREKVSDCERTYILDYDLCSIY